MPSICAGTQRLELSHRPRSWMSSPCLRGTGRAAWRSRTRVGSPRSPLPRPRRHLAVAVDHRPYVVGAHRVHGGAAERRLQPPPGRAGRQQRARALAAVRLVPRLHGEEPAVAHLDPDGGAGGGHGVDHRGQPEHALTGVDQRHTRAGATLLVEARVALDDQADPGLGAGDELLGVLRRAVGTVAGAVEDGRRVEPVAHRRGPPDPQPRVEGAHDPTSWALRLPRRALR